MKVAIDERVSKFIQKLGPKDSAKVLSYIELFEAHGFALGQNYLKKGKSQYMGT